MTKLTSPSHSLWNYEKNDYKLDSILLLWKITFQGIFLASMFRVPLSLQITIPLCSRFYSHSMFRCLWSLVEWENGWFLKYCFGQTLPSGAIGPLVKAPSWVWVVGGSNPTDPHSAHNSFKLAWNFIFFKPWNWIWLAHGGYIYIYIYISGDIWINGKI